MIKPRLIVILHMLQNVYFTEIALTKQRIFL